MDTVVVRQFLDFFQEFLNLCQLENWPENHTTEAEIKNAFLAAQHIEKCLNKFQSRHLLNELLFTLNSYHDTSKTFLENCLLDPAKYLLKKIITAKTKTTQMDIGFKVFLQIYSEEKLEDYLADIMLEAASKETLLRNLNIEFTMEKLLELKSLILLTELSSCEDSKDSLLELLDNCNKDTVELLVVSLINKDYKYHKSINNILNAFTQIMLRKKHTDKSFWKLLLRVKEEYFIELCLAHGSLFKILASALLDSGKLLKEHLSADYFYIDLTYSELVMVTKAICKNDNLKIEFLDIIHENDSDIEFWENVMS